MYRAAAAAAKSLQSCPTLFDPTDGSPVGSAIPGILQTRTLEWVAISFSNAWKWKVKVKSLSRVRLFATPWTAARQAPPSMGFSRQEYWSRVPLPSPMYRTRYWIFCPRRKKSIKLKNNNKVKFKKEFTGPGLHLRPVHDDHARPPLQWTLNSVFSAYGNDKRRIRPPLDRGILKIVSRLLLA